MSEKYNNWSNYSTWATNLWLTNDQESQAWLYKLIDEETECAKVCEQVNEKIWTLEEAAVYIAADRLKKEIEEDSPLTQATLYSDLLNAALSEVNWQEIVRNNKT